MLNDWLISHSLGHKQAGLTSTFVCVDARDRSTILGFYSLATGIVSRDAETTRVKRGVPLVDIPAVILARMAVRIDAQRAGLGKALLRDALLRLDAVSESVSFRCLLVHAKDDAVRTFYLRCAEFEPSPTDPLNLQLLIKDLRRITRF